MRISRTAAAAAALVAAGVVIAVQVLSPASPSASSSAPVGGGAIVPASSAPASGTPATASQSVVRPSATEVSDSQRVAFPALAYVTYLHRIDYSLGYPGWKPSSFDGILTGDLLAAQTRRNATASAGPTTAGDRVTWESLVASGTITETVIEKSSVVPKTGGGWLVQINWHLETSANGSRTRSGSIFTVITVVDVNGAYLAASDDMPQAP